MLETLRTETGRVHMLLIGDVDGASEQAVTQRNGKYYARANEFVYLRTKVTNMSCKPAFCIFA